MSNNKVYLRNDDGTLLDIDTWHRLEHDSWAHVGYYETISRFIENMNYYKAKGGDALCIEMGYTPEILVEKIHAINDKYQEYLMSDGVVGEVLFSD